MWANELYTHVLYRLGFHTLKVAWKDKTRLFMSKATYVYYRCALLFLFQFSLHCFSFSAYSLAIFVFLFSLPASSLWFFFWLSQSGFFLSSFSTSFTLCACAVCVSFQFSFYFHVCFTCAQSANTPVREHGQIRFKSEKNNTITKRLWFTVIFTIFLFYQIPSIFLFCFL